MISQNLTLICGVDEAIGTSIMDGSSETKRLPDPLQIIQNQKRLKVHDLRDLKPSSSFEASEANDEDDDHDDARPEAPTADWKSLQHTMNLIRANNFKQLCEETGYPLKGRSTTTSVDQALKTLRTKSTRVPHVPNTRAERGVCGYRYYDSTTGDKISAKEYESRYKQSLDPPRDWETYFSHLHLQKSLQAAAPTIPSQIQAARDMYASKLAPKLAELREENHETTLFHDSLGDDDEIDESQSTMKDLDD